MAGQSIGSDRHTGATTSPALMLQHPGFDPLPASGANNPGTSVVLLSNVRLNCR
ncbi:MAG: hypothetical protein KF866_09490 [Phycisphaeraceae bacterium]|nr:hypothetical protein [Phycisphaeraceae bacterium]